MGVGIQKENLIEINKMGVYVHIPFCVKKCNYCDFLSSVADDDIKEKYIEALKKEMALNKDRMKEYSVNTIFFGGGTPSILKGEMIVELLSVLKQNCHVESDCEITIECNPGTLTEEKLLLYKEAGVNRLSIGLQSSNDNLLKAIGRIHTYEQFRESYRLARRLGFNNINVDIMSGLPGQTVDTFRDTLGQVMLLWPEHISVYSLIVEEGTVLDEQVKDAVFRGERILPKEDDERRMYYVTEDILKQNAFKKYEISNYAQPGCECRHNIGYWKRKDYLGFGIGAASLYKEERHKNISDINQYINIMNGDSDDEFKSQETRFASSSVICGQSPTENKFSIGSLPSRKLKQIQSEMEVLTKKGQMEEFIFLGLRMMDGISKTEFKEKFGQDFETVYGDVTKKLSEQRLLIDKGDTVKLTGKGIDISNYVMSEFML